MTIKQASGLPLSLSNYVFCQYQFWGEPEPTVVQHIIEKPDCLPTPSSLMFQFSHAKEFVVPITEEFMEHCSGMVAYNNNYKAEKDFSM